MKTNIAGLAKAIQAGDFPASGEIVGILKTMGDEMKGSLKDVEDGEAAAITEFDGLVAANAKELNALTESSAKDSKGSHYRPVILQQMSDALEHYDEYAVEAGEEERKQVDRICTGAAPAEFLAAESVLRRLHKTVDALEEEMPRAAAVLRQQGWGLVETCKVGPPFVKRPRPNLQG